MTATPKPKTKLTLSPENRRKAEKRIPAWNHQNWLKEQVGKELELAVLGAANPMRVTLLAADAYSMLVKPPTESPALIFKSNIQWLKQI